jgi:hypothetical protein
MANCKEYRKSARSFKVLADNPGVFFVKIFLEFVRRAVICGFEI